MFLLTDRDYATLIMDTGTLLMIISIIYLILLHRKKGHADEACFMVLLGLNMVMAVGDVIAYVFETKDFAYARVLSTLGMTFFYIAFVTISMTWLHYCRIRFRGVSKKEHFAIEYLPGIVMIILVAITGFTGWVFSYDENMAYNRGFLFIPMYILMAAYIIAGFVIMSKYRDQSSGKVLIPAWVYGIPIIVGMIFTFLVPNSASFAPISTAMSIVFTHMGTVNEIKG